MKPSLGIAQNKTTTSEGSLFLLVLSLLSLVRRALLADTDKAGLGASVTELPESVLGGLEVADLALLELDLVLDGKGDLGAADNVLSALGSLDVLGGGVTLLGLAVAAGEENETLPVLLEALDVGLKTLLGKVLAAGVDRDTDGAGELAGDTGGCLMLVVFYGFGAIAIVHTLQLNERETTAGPDTAVVYTALAIAYPAVTIATYT